MTDIKEGLPSTGLQESAFSLFYNSSGKLIKVDHPPQNEAEMIDNTLPYEARVEREYVHVFGENPKILVASLFHGDEKGDREERDDKEVFSLVNSVVDMTRKIKIPAVVIPFAHPLAGMMNTREYDTGRGKVDINRIFKFDLEGKPKTYDEVIRQINYPEGRLLLEVCKMFPNLEYIFPIHMDVAEGEDMVLGPYMYYTPFSDMDDFDKELVRRTFAGFTKIVKDNKFYIHSGKDDIIDPKLGNDVREGFCYDPCSKGGVESNLGSLDEALVKMGSMGINRVRASFNLEIPKYRSMGEGEIPIPLRSEGQKIIANLYFKNFVIPFLKAKGIYK